jgi:uncharacterized DUF497 family protein
VSAIRFEWNDDKAAANRRKHRVSFEEAQTVFSDEQALFMADPDHSAEEDRFILLGVSAALRVLVVCHCYRRGDEIIRIISARKANRSERAEYEQRCFP